MTLQLNRFLIPFFSAVFLLLSGLLSTAYAEELSPAARAEQKALDSAEGFGANTIAGVNGEWCLVTTLADDGSGSLRECVAGTEPRTVYFQVSGIIWLSAPLVIKNPYITIDGSTAPNGGILLTVDRAIDGPVLQIATHDVLVRHIRVRAGEADIPTCCRDAVSIGSTLPGEVYNIILDHNSFSWGTDEVVEIVGDSNRITLSYNIISEGLHRAENTSGNSGRGLLILEDAHQISLHHNIFAHNFQRNPGVYGADEVDMVNNLIYHWVSRGMEISTRNDKVNMNIVNNVFIAHNQNQEEPTAVKWYDIQLSDSADVGTAIYLQGNLGYWRTDETQAEYSLVATDWNTPYRPSLGLHTTSRHPFPEINLHETQGLEEFLLQHAGATVPRRDSVDERLIEEIQGRYGRIRDCVQDCDNNALGWPDLSSPN